MLRKILAVIAALFIAIFSSKVAFANETQSIFFATEATYPPFESVNGFGVMQGYDIDIAKALCKVMHAHCSFHNVPWESLLPSLELGKYDVIFGAMAITSARQKHVDFTKPYYFDSAAFVVPKSSTLQLTKLAMQGKTIGVQGGTTYVTYLRDYYGGAVTIKQYPSIQNALLDLQSGRLDAVLGDTPIMTTWLKSHYGYQILGHKIEDSKYFGNGVGFAVNKSNSKLLAKLNKALITIKANGEYAAINAYYFGSH